MRPPARIANREAAVWLPAAALGLVFAALALWRVGVDVLPLALSADTTLTEIRRISVDDLAVADGRSLADAGAALDSLAADVGPAADSMRWLARLSPALSWLPVVDRELRAWAAQARRLELDLESASRLLAASSELLDAYERAQATLQAPGVRPAPSARTPEPDLESSFRSGIADVTTAGRLGGRHRPAFGPPGLLDALALLEDVESDMVRAARIGQQASALLAELLAIADRLQPLAARLLKGSPDEESLSLEELRATVADLDDAIQFALVRSDGVAKLIADSEQANSLLGRLGTLREVLGVLLFVNRAVAVGVDAVGPALQGPVSGESGLLGSHGTLVAVLRSVAAHRDDIGEAMALLEHAEETLADLAADDADAQATGGFAQLAEILDVLRSGMQLMYDLAPVGSELVAVDSTKRYLVLGQSADELRATGGFVSGVWLVTFENGSLADVRYHDAVRVDDWERLVLYPPAPRPLEVHMNARVWLLRDVSWEPDFPTTARTAADMYRIGQRQEVDGVVALNQWVLLEALAAIGSIASPGGGAPITPLNLLSRMEQGTDEHGRVYADLTLQGLLDRLDEPSDVATFMKLGAALFSSLQQRDLLLLMNDPEVQSVIEKNGWDGRLRGDTADYLYVVDSNVGWSKSDRNVERQLSYQVDLRKEAGPRITLNLGYNNFSGPGSPGCFPQWRHRGTEYGDLKNACLWNYLRVYVPLGARLLSNTPLPLPELSVAVEVGRGLDGDDTFEVSSSFNKAVFSGLFALGAGERQEITLVYDLPSSVERREGDDIVYTLTIQKQPGVRRREVLVEFLLPEGHSLATSSIEPASTGDSRVAFAMSLERDTTLSAVFTRGEGGQP